MVDRESLKIIRAQIDAALADIATLNGLQTLRTGACTFDREGSFTFKVEGLAQGGLSREAQAYKQYAAFYKRMPELFAVVKLGAAREDYRITGLRRTKVLAEKLSNGKTYLFQLAQLERHFSAKIAEPA
jgi:hypothetical protein